MPVVGLVCERMVALLLFFYGVFYVFSLEKLKGLIEQMNSSLNKGIFHSFSS